MTFELVFMRKDAGFELRMEKLQFVAVDGKPVASDNAVASVEAFLGE